MVNGYDFADVVLAYWKGFEEGNEQLKADAVRWMRGEFTTRTDARAALGVRTIVVVKSREHEDDNRFSRSWPSRTTEYVWFDTQ